MTRRVLIIVENLPVPFDRRVWLEARTLAAAGYAVSVICPRSPDHPRRFEVLDGARIYRHPLPAEGAGRARYIAEYLAAHAWQIVLSAWIAVRHGFDVVHVCNPPDTNVLVAAVWRLFGKRVIFDHHDLSPELYEAKFGRRGGVWRLLLAIEGLAFRIAHTVIANNHSYRAVAIGRGRKRPKDVFVVRTGPDLVAWPTPAPAPARRDATWRDGRRFLLGYLGVIGEQDGVDLLVRAMGVLVHGPAKLDARLLVIGDGPARAAAEALSARLGLEDHIAFLGRAPDSVALSALGEADVCVNPDRPGVLNDRSTMNKVMEYMALSRPIVQFEATEGRYSAAEASLYAAPWNVADFADKVLTLLADPDRCRRMGEAGRRRIEDALAWSHQAPHLLAAYEHAFAPAPRTARRASPARAADIRLEVET